MLVTDSLLYNFFFNCSLHQEVIAQRALDRYENIICVLTVACSPRGGGGGGGGGEGALPPPPVGGGGGGGRGVGMGPYPHPLGELACWLCKLTFVVKLEVSKIC